MVPGTFSTSKILRIQISKSFDAAVTVIFITGCIRDRSFAQDLLKQIDRGSDSSSTHFINSNDGIPFGPGAELGLVLRNAINHII